MASFTLRPPRRDDVPALVALERESEVESGMDPETTETDVLSHWTHPRIDPERHYILAEQDGEIVAHANLHFEGAQARSGGWVRAAYRGRGIGRALVDWAIATAATEPDVTELYQWVNARLPDAVALVDSIEGAELARSFLGLINRAPASVQPAEWPVGIELRPLRGDELVDAVVEAHDDSFVDHWNFLPASRDDVAHDLARPDEDPDLWFVAFAGDRIAGFNICHLSPESRSGWIGPLGTTRPFRGIGLGRALLRHGLRALAARGARQVMLGVDAENPSGAVGLYLRNGFEVLREGRVYRIKLPR